MDEIIEDITIANLQVNNNLYINNLIQPENNSIISIGNKLSGSLLLKNIQIGYEQNTMKTFTIITGTKSKFLSELNNNSTINIYYKYYKYPENTNNDILYETSFNIKVKYIINDFLIILDFYDAFGNDKHYHQYLLNTDNSRKSLDKNNLADSIFLQVEIIPDIFIYNLSNNDNFSTINILSYKPIDVEIYLPIIKTNLNYNIIINNPLKSFNIITNDNNYITGSFILNSENLLYQSIQDDTSISTNNKFVTKSILVSSSNNYNNKSRNFFINQSNQGLLSANIKLFNINNNDWNLSGYMLGNLHLLNKTPQIISKIEGIQNSDNSLNWNLNINFNINNNNFTYIDSDDINHLQIINNIIKIYNNNNNTTILLNKYFKYSISFKNNNINTNIYTIRFFYLKINNKYDVNNEVSSINIINSNFDGVIYNNNILDLSHLNKYNKIYYIILKSFNQIININDNDQNIISQGIINIIDTQQSFYINNIKDINNNNNIKLLFPNLYYNVYNPFITLLSITHNTYYNNNLDNIKNNLENNGLGFYKIRKIDSNKFYPLYFSIENSNQNSSDNTSIIYGPYSSKQNQFNWNNNDFINYYMPNSPNSRNKYNPYNNIQQLYLPNKQNMNPDPPIINNIDTSQIGETYINYTWNLYQNEISDISSRNNIKSFIIQSYINNGWTTIETTSVNSFTYNNLLSNTQYSVRIYSKNFNDYISEYSLYPIITTKISQTLNLLPNPIRNLQTNSNTNTIILSWDPPINNSSNIIGYNIDIYDNDKWINIVNLTSQFFYRLPNLLSNKYYKFRIASVNTVGISNYIITDDSLKTL
jgi:hypothetical protein